MERVDMVELAQKSSSATQGKPVSGTGAGAGAGQVLIKELNDNDVLQGRGSGSMQNTGNIKFRNLVEKLRPAYVATSSRKEKAKMISDMVQLIQSRKGRFLQRLCDKEVEEMGLDSQNGDFSREQDRYVEMTDDEAAEKAKQAIRYVHYKKVPLEEERRKKRAADNDYLTGNDKSNGETSHRIGYGANSLALAPVSANMANQISQGPQANIRAGMTNAPHLQQTDISQLLATFQTAQAALASQYPGNIYSASQNSIQRDVVQQASIMQHLAGGINPMVSNVQQQHNTLQQLASSLFSNSNNTLPPKVSHRSSNLLDTTSNQNVNQQQLPQQQTQLNILLQSMLQQQTNSQSNSILQTLLQQQQQQSQLNSALQTLQQQHQLNSAIQSLQQSQQLSPGPQFQQQLQQNNANSILASLLSNAKTNTQTDSSVGPLISNTSSTVNSLNTAVKATNALLTSFLSNNAPQASAFQQSGNSEAQGTDTPGPLLRGLNMKDINNITTITGQQQQEQHNGGLLGASALQKMPGLAQNIDTLLAANTNANTNDTFQADAIVTTADGNIAKRPRLSSDNVADNAV